MRHIVPLLLLLAAPLTQATQERLALVIGNADYKSEEPLVNTLNDARDVAAKLQGIGFEVTRVENAGLRALGRAIADFLRRVQGSDAVALVYYSGHGLQVNGQNYLIPVDAQIRDELDVPQEGVPINRMLAELGDRGDKAVNLVILDACRNNPFKKDGSKSVGDKGLARVNAPGGTLILYATKPGDTASDNPGGKNGLFTQHLLQALDQQGKQVEDAFKEAAEKVYLASGRRQDPWMEGRIRGRFYFVPAPPGAPGAVPIPPGAPVVADPEILFWQSCLQYANPECYREYLRAYPNGRFAAIARTQAERLEAPEAIEQALGLSREERAQVQAALNALGHEVGAADGIWGRDTRTGIEAWQRSAGREATGYLAADSYKQLLAQAQPRLAARQAEAAQREAQAQAAAPSLPAGLRRAAAQAERHGYRVHADGTVTDTRSGLMWKRCAEGQGGFDCTGTAAEYTWDDAMARFRRGVSFAGHDDWRLPTREELRTLVWCSNGTPREEAWDHTCGGKNGRNGDYQRPTIVGAAFPNTPSSWFWSASAHASDSGNAWDVHFDYGIDYWGHRSYAKHVRLVRAGQ